MMNEMLRNGSGYVDMTAYNGMMNAAPGEIWTQIDRDDEYYLIIAINGKVNTALKLTSRDTDGSIPVGCHGQMYTNPAMLNYIFANRLGGYVKTMPKKEFEDVRKAVADALGFTLPVDSEGRKTDEEQEMLKKQLEEAKVDLCIHKDTNDMLGKSISRLEMEIEACKPYREMYNVLLDKLIAAKAGAVI